MPVTLDQPNRKRLIDRRLMRQIAEQARADITTRTRKGLGADGKRLRRKKDGSASTLTASGRMLSTLKVSVTETGLTIEPTVNYARYVEAAGRPFLDLTDDEREQYVRDLTAIIERRMRGEG